MPLQQQRPCGPANYVLLAGLVLDIGSVPPRTDFNFDMFAWFAVAAVSIVAATVSTPNVHVLWFVMGKIKLPQEICQPLCS